MLKIGEEEVHMQMVWATQAEALAYANAVVVNLSNQGYSIEEMGVSINHDYYGNEDGKNGYRAQVMAQKTKETKAPEAETDKTASEAVA